MSCLLNVGSLFFLLVLIYSVSGAQYNFGYADYVKTSGEASKSKTCDPEDLRICDGYREPHEWGCCMRYKWPQTLRNGWLGKSCYCDHTIKNCIIERRIGRDVQWTYCIPNTDFDCYWKFTIAGKSCPEDILDTV